jgi:hypothetical protein
MLWLTFGLVFYYFPFMRKHFGSPANASSHHLASVSGCDGAADSFGAALVAETGASAAIAALPPRAALSIVHDTNTPSSTEWTEPRRSVSSLDREARFRRLALRLL